MPFFPSALFIRGCGSSNGRRQPYWDSPSVTEEHAETASGHLSSPQRTAAWRRRWSFGYFSWMCQPLVSRWLTDWLIGFFLLFSGDEEETTCVTGEREKAAALMMACRHLPLPFLSGPCQRKKMLVEAATSLEKIGDKRTLQECQQLLLQLNSVSAVEWQQILNWHRSCYVYFAMYASKSFVGPSILSNISLPFIALTANSSVKFLGLQES